MVKTTYDLSQESDRIAFLEAMALDRAIFGRDPESPGLEAALSRMDRDVLHKLVGTAQTLGRTRRERSIRILEKISARHVPQSD